MGQSGDHYHAESHSSFRSLFDEVRFLNIGHVCHDVASNGYLLGGTVSYASLITKKLGIHSGVITSHGEDFQFEERFQNLQIPLWNSGSLLTTCFENIYDGGNRTQYLRAQASKVQVPNDIQKLEKLQIIQLGLIADEVDMTAMEQLPKDCLKGASIQGWLRDTDKNQKVFTKRPDLSLFEKLDIAFMSTEDLGTQQDLLPEILELVPITVVTKGYQGARVYIDGKKLSYGAYPCKEIDPTGAGDVFSTSFLIAYNESHDIEDAVAFAHSAASISIEGKGVHSLPTKEAVEERKEIYKKKYL